MQDTQGEIKMKIMMAAEKVMTQHARVVVLVFRSERETEHLAGDAPVVEYFLL